jgi:hypothetical protein
MAAAKHASPDHEDRSFASHRTRAATPSTNGLVSIPRRRGASSTRTDRSALAVYGRDGRTAIEGPSRLVRWGPMTFLSKVREVWQKESGPTGSPRASTPRCGCSPVSPTGSAPLTTSLPCLLDRCRH